ncbi:MULTISPECIES: aromatic ring-hydroxylating dioxygenase subunit alpha [Methylococcus]|uniref:Aromatic ring-hydroxylating dioxygenase subunit alpha n=1 Tax=Methylococcus capsulatus TaxID=414 RepID=A0ABZ2F1A8_METCP|nr:MULTISPECIES: aromatic ring-hydroxylating dioxygenase subunit alpha [Methylococcus]MDF9392168.1 aromatic ring-hydroxylating dioxygenase subunit alpha [Methylococcus capsulatus]QXP90399.1 aromatic ring-hydroxylating dioxygenase subunit alpha [Methylococcus capsulatus]
MSRSIRNQDVPELPRRRQVRTVGMSGNYWYVVEIDGRLKPRQVKRVRFWGQDIALFRDAAGELHAVEDRCPHRQLPLSQGFVEGGNLVCTYHGWKFDGCGRCTEIHHELGKGRTRLPRIRIRTYPVKAQWGLIWLFPGDPALADGTPLPTIPQLEGGQPWPFFPIDVTIKAHFSMIVENVCDFNHEYLHRHKRPFLQPILREWKQDADSVRVYYDTRFDGSPVAKLFMEGGARDLNEIEIWYQYPYQGSDIGGKYIHWLFMLPEDERTTRCFFVFLFGPIHVPIVNWKMPEFLRKPILWFTNKWYIEPLLGEDKWALELEQDGFERHPDAPQIELNPAISSFQKLSLEKWKAYQQSMERAGPKPAADPA